MDRWKLLACGFALPGTIPGALWAQLGERIEVEAHRLLATIADRLEARFGIAVNYEDPPYVALEDLEDVVSSKQKAEQPGYQLLVPRKGRVRIENPSLGERAGLASACPSAGK